MGYANKTKIDRNTPLLSKETRALIESANILNTDEWCELKAKRGAIEKEIVQTKIDIDELRYYQTPGPSVTPSDVSDRAKKFLATGEIEIVDRESLRDKARQKLKILEGALVELRETELKFEEEAIKSACIELRPAAEAITLEILGAMEAYRDALLRQEQFFWLCDVHNLRYGLRPACWGATAQEYIYLYGNQIFMGADAAINHKRKSWKLVDKKNK